MRVAWSPPVVRRIGERTLHGGAHAGGWALRRAWRAGTWVFRSRLRLVVAAWMTGFFWIGQASIALADDGLINGPDLGSAGGQTVFEQYGPDRFSLYLQLSDSNHGAPYIKESMWNFLRTIESALMYLLNALTRGAITSMEWVLNLNLYPQNAAAIDSAVRSVAAQVFWPLFASTMAIGAFSAYGRMKREGGGSLFQDAAWLVAASMFAGAFAIAPSTVMTDLDNLRTGLAAAAMKGYADSAPAGSSAAGFPPVSLPADQAGATRRLADAMWNVYVVTPWCYVNYNSMATCEDVGHDYITGDARWNALVAWMNGKNGGNSDDTDGAYCPKELNANCDWIRGQSFGRLGATIFVVATTIPLVVMLLVLVLYGVMAVVGFLLLVLVGLFFVLGWMIPGRLRQMGVRWFEEVLSSLIQSVIITAVLGSVMVLDAILNAGIPTYGFFMVGLLNLASFVVGFRMRGRLENITGLGAGGTSSPFSGYMAMRAVAGIGRGASKLTRGAIGGAVTATPILAGAAMGMTRFGGQLGGAGLHGMSSAAHLLKTLPDSLIATHPASRGGGITPPQHRGHTGPGRKVLEPSPRRGNGGGPSGEWPELPPGPTTVRGRSQALEASGIGQETVDGRRVYVAAATPSPQRTFTPTDYGPRARAAGRMDETFGVAGPLITGRQVTGANAFRAARDEVPGASADRASTLGNYRTTSSGPLWAPPTRQAMPQATRRNAADPHRPTTTALPVGKRSAARQPSTEASAQATTPAASQPVKRGSQRPTAAAQPPRKARTPGTRSSTPTTPASGTSPVKPSTPRTETGDPAAAPRAASKPVPPPTPRAQPTQSPPAGEPRPTRRNRPEGTP